MVERLKHEVEILRASHHDRNVAEQRLENDLEEAQQQAEEYKELVGDLWSDRI